MVVAAETVVDEEVVEVNAISISTRGMVASRGTTKTRGTVRMAGAEILGEGDTTNLRITTLPRLKPRVIRTGDTHPKAITRTTNGAGTGDRLSRHTTPGLRTNNLPTEVAGEGTIQDTMVRTVAGRMGTVEGEEALLPIEEGARLMAVVGMAIKEVREGGMGMAVTVTDTTNLHRTAVTVEVVTTGGVVITLVEATNQVKVIDQAEVISLVDHTAPVSSLTGTEEDITKGVGVVEGGIDHTGAHAHT